MGLFEIIFLLQTLFVFILTVPLIDSYKQSIIVFMSGIEFLATLKYLYYVSILVVSCIFVESAMETRYFHSINGFDLNYFMKLQKTTLTGFILFLSFVLARLVNLLKKTSQLKSSDLALQKQAKNASSTVISLMKENDSLKIETKRLKEINFGGNTGKEGKEKLTLFQKVESLEEKILHRNKEISDLEKALKKEKKENAEEKSKRVKLEALNSNLKTELEDFKIMYGGKSKTE